MSRGRQWARARAEGSEYARGGRTQGETDGPSALVQLAKRFARFRSERPRGARYPDELREGVLRLFGEVAPEALYRACGVSFRQVMAWKAAHRFAPAKTPEAEPAQVRVFSVVDEEPVVRLEPEAVGRAGEAVLELRVGPWSVSVRLVDGRPALRGRA
jgi:hypothetical protein